MSLENKNEKVWYRDSFNTFKNKLNGESELFIGDLRKEAISKFENMNFPTLKDEEWKYTNVSSIIKNNYTPAFNDKAVEISTADVDKFFLSGFECCKLVFVNGVFNKELSQLKLLTGGVLIGNLRDAVKERPELVQKYYNGASKINNAFNALNNAFALDGLFVYVPAGKKIEIPLQVLFINGSSSNMLLSNLKNIIVAEESSSVNIIMNYAGLNGNPYLTNVMTEVYTAENASVNIYKIQNESENSYHIEQLDALQSASSLFNHYSATFGALITRNDINAKLNGKNSECHFYGLYLGSGKQHIDNHTFADHAQPECFSNELYKGIMDDESKAVFNGKIMVRPDAQKTNAYQSNKNIILSENASVDSKPQLEIYADDVKCSHGATVGRLDETAYFYIRSRGVPADMAKSMLIRAFANDVIESIKIPELKEHLNHMIFGHLHSIEITNQ